jgi:hypothetical protein
MIRAIFLVLSLMMVGCTTTQQEQPAGMIFGVSIPGAPDKATNLRFGEVETDLRGALWVKWTMPIERENGDLLTIEELDYVCVYINDDPCVKVDSPTTYYMTPTSLPVGIYHVQITACDVWGSCSDKTPRLTAEIPADYYD